jgi:hypothetical protein
MHSEMKVLFDRAEENYLSPSDMIVFKHQINRLSKSLETYKYLRDREVDIFQSVVERFSETSSQINPRILEQAIKDWLLIIRYGAMAMLLNNPQFLEHRLLEWLSDRVKAHQLQEIETQLYHLLIAELKQSLTEDQFEAIEPFLTQAKTTLLESVIFSEVGV